MTRICLKYIQDFGAEEEVITAHFKAYLGLPFYTDKK